MGGEGEPGGARAAVVSHTQNPTNEGVGVSKELSLIDDVGGGRKEVGNVHRAHVRAGQHVGHSVCFVDKDGGRCS